MSRTWYENSTKNNIIGRHRTRIIRFDLAIRKTVFMARGCVCFDFTVVFLSRSELLRLPT